MEQCENCGRVIGKLETPMVYREQVVCRACHRTLTEPDGSELVAAAPAPTPAAKPTRVAAAPPPASVSAAVQQNVLVQVQSARGASGLGVVALVMGILALIASWIPFTGLVALPLGGLGLLFATLGFVVSMTGRHSSVGLPVAGGLACCVAIAVALASTVATTRAIGRGAEVIREKVTAQGVTAADAFPGLLNANNSGGPAAASPAPTPPAAPGLQKARGLTTVARMEGVRIEARTLTIGVPSLEQSGRSAKTETPAMMLGLAITNTRSTGTIDYRSFARNAPRESPITIRDERGNTYRTMHFSSATVVGAQGSGPILPGQTREDIVLIEVPAESARQFTIELEGASVGLRGQTVKLLLSR